MSVSDVFFVGPFTLVSIHSLPTYSFILKKSRRYICFTGHERHFQDSIESFEGLKRYPIATTDNSEIDYYNYRRSRQTNVYEHPLSGGK